MFGIDAAEDLRRNRDQFVRNVKQTMGGMSLRGQQYDNVIEG
jgi:ubiquitin-conjugating enzyme E2 M